MSDAQRPQPAPSSTAGRVAVLAGGVLFVLSLLGFLEFYLRRWGTAAGAWSLSAAASPVAIDIALFTLFAAHHSVFARLGVRDWVRSAVSPRYERSVYVWISSLLFAAVYVGWRPVPGMLWSLTGSVGTGLLAVQLVGAAISVLSARRLDVLDLAGIRQGFDAPAGRPPGLVTDGVYGLVRHPIYLGWLLLVWPTPVMTGTRFVFAAISTAYLVAVVPLEERVLVRMFGTAYRDYGKKVRWRILPGVY